MKRRTIALAVLLALTIALLFATTASAKPEVSHFVAYGEGRLDSHSTLYTVEMGIPYPMYSDPSDPTTLYYVLVDGYIDVTIDAESIGDASGPYHNSDGDTWWNYKAKGTVTAEVHIIAPDGTHIDEVVKAHVRKATYVYAWTGYSLEVRCQGKTYGMYVGENSWGYFVWLSFIGKAMGNLNGIYNGVLYSSAGDEFPLELNDDLAP